MFRPPDVFFRGTIRLERCGVCSIINRGSAKDAYGYPYSDHDSDNKVSASFTQTVALFESYKSQEVDYFVTNFRDQDIFYINYEIYGITATYRLPIGKY